MQALLFQVSAAIVTSFLFAFVFFRKAKRSGEAPQKLSHLSLAILGGLGALVLAFFTVRGFEGLLAEVGLSTNRILAPLEPQSGLPQLPLITLLFLFAFFEEGAKLLFIVFMDQRGFIPAKQPGADSCSDFGDETRRRGVLLGLCLGLSFGIAENLVYALGYSDLFLMRQLSTVPLHGFTAALLGKSFDSGVSALKPLILMTLAHGFYNLCLYLEQPWYLLSFLLLIGLRVTVYRSLIFPEAEEHDENESEMDEHVGENRKN